MLVGRIERNATPRRLASKMGSQASSRLNLAMCSFVEGAKN